MKHPYYLMLMMLLSIAFIIWATAHKKINAFLVLLIAAFSVALLTGLPLTGIVGLLKSGFAHTMEKIGLLVILGTLLGVVLEKTGATISMANSILKHINEKRAPLAISLIGFIVGLPIFCDSGFIVLSGLNRSLVIKSKQGMAVMATALGTSLYSVHCLVPPHPGISAAVGAVGGDMGLVMLWGITLSIPAAIVGYWWSNFWGSKFSNKDTVVEDVQHELEQKMPSSFVSFLPVFFPIFLIALKSVMTILFIQKIKSTTAWFDLISFLGDPVVALGVGLILALLFLSDCKEQQIIVWLGEGVEKSGMILILVAGGGLFGEVLNATGMGANLGNLLGGAALGIFFPFVVTAILKTAQGSSTVAIITVAALVTPLLSSLGLNSSLGMCFALLSMGAGSMVVSHANDAYFWVITRFSGLETVIGLRVYTTATLAMGVTVQLLLWGLSNWLL